jgi:hypothetical protein
LLQKGNLRRIRRTGHLAHGLEGRGVLCNLRLKLPELLAAIEVLLCKFIGGEGEHRRSQSKP